MAQPAQRGRGINGDNKAKYGDINCTYIDKRKRANRGGSWAKEQNIRPVIVTGRDEYFPQLPMNNANFHPQNPHPQWAMANSTHAQAQRGQYVFGMLSTTTPISQRAPKPCIPVHYSAPMAPNPSPMPLLPCNPALTTTVAFHTEQLRLLRQLTLQQQEQIKMQQQQLKFLMDKSKSTVE